MAKAPQTRARPGINVKTGLFLPLLCKCWRLAPTGRAVSLKGASIIQVEGDKIASDHTYFDRAAFDEQLNPKASE